MRPEDALQMSICDYLKQALPSTAWFCSIPNGAVLAGDKTQRMRQMAKLKATGLRVGAPDLFVINEGAFIAIEVKAGNGKASDAQLATADDVWKAGGVYGICRSINDVQALLSHCGVLLRARAA